MRQSSALDNVLAWQAAVNAQDLNALLEHSAPDIAVVGPRGTGMGHQLLREWLSRARAAPPTPPAILGGETGGLPPSAVLGAAGTGARDRRTTVGTGF